MSDEGRREGYPSEALYGGLLITWKAVNPKYVYQLR
jgi:hypothetical protein